MQEIEIIKAKIRAINDAMRSQLFTMTGGMCVVTRGVHDLHYHDKARILSEVKNYDDFNEDNDPHEEHDFGVIELKGIPKIFWKIDYFEDSKMDFNLDSKFGENKEDFITAYRVITIMLADEY